MATAFGHNSHYFQFAHLSMMAGRLETRKPKKADGGAVWAILLGLVVSLGIFLPSPCRAQITTVTAIGMDREPVARVPGWIKAKMDTFVISKTGIEVFKKYFVFDYAHSGLHPANPGYFQIKPNAPGRFMAYARYSIAYIFRFPDKPWR